MSLDVSPVTPTRSSELSRSLLVPADQLAEALVAVAAVTRWRLRAGSRS